MKLHLSLPFRAVLFCSLTLSCGTLLSATGCSQPAPPEPPAAPLVVSVSLPIEREVTDYSDFTARLAAVESVEVRAHVWGYLEKVNFKEGSLVKKGDVLFELDARPYQGQLNHAKARLAQDEAQLKFDEAEYQRSLTLFQRGAISQAEVDRATAARERDMATIAADKALLNQATLNLNFANVIAPICGRIGRYNVTVGNLVQSGDQSGGTLLTTIVSVDPIYAYFDMDERTVLLGRQLAREGKAKAVEDGELPVSLGLITEEGFPHKGTINFVDNQINPKTGTLRMRGVFPNADEALSPGLFGRVRVPMGNPHKALLVSDRALDNDQGQRILYVVNKENKVVSRPVVLGGLHDGLRAIEAGLEPGEQVIVEGIQLVRPDLVVEPKVVPMPVSGVRAPAPAVNAAAEPAAGPAADSATTAVQPGTVKAE